MGTYLSYPRITDYQDTSTHERVTRVHHEMNESETIHECNT